MCLNLSSLQLIVQYLPFVVFFFGLASTIITHTIFGRFMDQLYYLDYFTNVNPNEGILISLNVFSSILVSSSLCGIVGNQKKICSLSMCYNITNIFLLIGFFVIAIIGFTLGNSAAWNHLFEQSNCYSANLVYNSVNLNDAYEQAEGLFCKQTFNGQEGCECYYYYALNSNTSSAVEYYNSTNNKLKPTQVQQCKQAKNKTYIFNSPSDYFFQVEQHFKCSGWCTYYPIYVFSNINYGNPKQSCFTAVSQTSKSITKIVSIVSISVTSFMVICITLVLLICFHPQKRQQSNFYTRMTYYN